MKECPRCLNNDPHYFYEGHKGTYCRKCVSYGRILLDAHEQDYYYSEPNTDAEYTLPFDLTDAQKAISRELAERCLKEDVLVYAACGAGKTEIVMESIRTALSQHKRVGYAIPRRQVVLEIGARMKQAFTQLKVVTVCEGFTKETEGDLIVCTTHQLYRYYKRFDLLILDEPDAFPFKGNAVLHGISRTSCTGHIIALSATPDEELKQYTTLTLFKRPHGYPLAVPKIVILPRAGLFLYLCHWVKHRQRVLIFVPTKRSARLLSKLLHMPYFTSETKNKEELVENFRNGTYDALVCTTVLERGVTFSNVQVIVWRGDHFVFDTSSLIQITGRVGRDAHYPNGEAVILCEKKSKEVVEARKALIRMNA